MTARTHLYAALCALVTTACLTYPALASDPGLTDDAVKIGTVGPVTGNPAVGMLSAGMKLKFDQVNEAGGFAMADGITRMIDLVIIDSANEPSRALTGARQLVESEGVFVLAGITGTLENSAIKPYLAQAKVPNLFVYSGVAEFADEEKNPYSSIGVPSFTTEGAVFVQYLKEHKPNAKIGILYFDTDFGRNFVDSVKAAVKGTEIEVVSVQPHGYLDPTVDSQLTNLRAGGVDTLLLGTIPTQVGQSIQFARETGWNPLIMASYAGSSAAALAAIGTDNLQGLITDQFLKQVTPESGTNDAKLQEYIDAYNKFAPRFALGDTIGQMGYTIGEAVVESLATAKEPTRAAVLEASRHLNGLEGAILLPGITMTSNGTDDPFPIESLQLFQFEGEGYKPLGSVISFEGKTPKL